MAQACRPGPESGPLGHAVLGALVGFVVYASAYALLAPLKVAVSFAPGSAVALGIVGGFGGVALLEKLGHLLSGSPITIA